MDDVFGGANVDVHIFRTRRSSYGARATVTCLACGEQLTVTVRGLRGRCSAMTAAVATLGDECEAHRKAQEKG